MSLRSLRWCSPPAVLEDFGSHFREVLDRQAEWEGKRFPNASLCAGRWPKIIIDHGGAELNTSDCLSVLASQHDAERAKSVDDETGGLEVDPLLEVCTALWQRTAESERIALERRARTEALFPVHREGDRTLVRVAVGNDPTFYPPQSASQDLPLRDLRFMCHAICWGALSKNERQAALEDRMKAWSALFGVKEFRFETVVQAAVLPALVLRSSQDTNERLDALRDVGALAAICQLAGRFVKPDTPLRYQRLESDRALMNLSRLPVPCRSTDGEDLWLPAYRVYFGKDWIGEDSVEEVATAIDGGHVEFTYLAEPETFFGCLEVAEPEASSTDSLEDDEIDIDEDIDRAIETNEKDRWINFLSWIGVNKALRAVHFHDVEDDGTTWLTTKDLARPNGWAFRKLGETWDYFETDLRNHLKGEFDSKTTTPYLYDAHDLDQIVPLIEAAENDSTAVVAQAVIEHFARHWPWFTRISDCQVALIEKSTSPGRRKVKRAYPNEIVSGGDNLWLRRLQRRGICPTELGPRPPAVTWQPSDELKRRFGRRGRTAEHLLPVLRESKPALSKGVRSFAERLGVRREPSPSTFNLKDAELLCRQLERNYSGRAVDATDLREVIKPVYRQLFELLSGQSTAIADHELWKVPLLADTTSGFDFMPAHEILYASTPGIRERTGLDGVVPVFVLEADPAATAPLKRLFRVRDLEEALDWRPEPGECSLGESELRDFREGLKDLMMPLLARIKVERTRGSDGRIMRNFMERVEPVEHLTMKCTFDGEPVHGLTERPYFVRPSAGDDPLQAFVVWEEGGGWPPPPAAAQGLAMALADALGINMVETFLAFIQSNTQHRLRLLNIAGASGLLSESEAEVLSIEGEPTEGREESQLEPTPAPKPTNDEEPAGSPEVETLPAAPPVPLVDFRDLTIDGESIIIKGDSDGGSVQRETHRREESGAAVSLRASRVAAGTDLKALDELGMRVAMAYEELRIRRIADQATAEDFNVFRSESVVVDVHSPKAIREAEGSSDLVKQVFLELEEKGVSRLYPGFDILTIVGGKPDRLIELKSSGTDARLQTMSWNEWKTARSNEMRPLFWLYLVGNLRSDLAGASPFVRAIRDPFGTLASDEISDRKLSRAVQLRVREFVEAEHLDLGVAEKKPTSDPGD